MLSQKPAGDVDASLDVGVGLGLGAGLGTQASDPVRAAINPHSSQTLLHPLLKLGQSSIVVNLGHSAIFLRFNGKLLHKLFSHVQPLTVL